MPKRMHDTSMDRGFGDESIGMKSAQLCSMNGRVYTPTRHIEILIFLKEGLTCVLQALDRGSASIEVFKLLERGLKTT